MIQDATLIFRAMLTKALTFGGVTMVLFSIVHWLCDLGWLEVLSITGFKGSEIFGQRAQLVVSAVCGLVLLGFGGKFLYDAGVGLSLALAADALREVQ